ncbi:hypothetical protein D9758_002782 [Tetrapyrgos nigripes]|uniref:MADS-box domain-containing protein n=1 Tax=Tetrapyrgos nigripes TaxID=182062 RepID=A0A8H5GQM4_9AGAR|nr:hypothetical protein D9758_002782 [Tetrapyrgos nigripes]
MRARDMAAAAPGQSDPIQHPGVGDDAFIADHDAVDSAGDDDDDDEKPKSEKKAGRRKIKIEFIQDKSRRHITFSKRKAGIMKKANKIPFLSSSVSDQTGLVYTFTTAKLQPLVTQPEGKNLIQACLNAPHGSLPSSMPVGAPLGRATNIGPPASAPANNLPGGLSIGQGQTALKEDEDASQDDDESVRGGRASAGDKRRRRASSNAGPPPPPAPGARSGNPTSPHSPNSSIPPPLSIPQGSGSQSQTTSTATSQIGLGGSPTSPQQGHAVPPSSGGQYSPTYGHAHPHTTHHASHQSHQSQGSEGGIYGATPAHMIPGSYPYGASQQPAPGGQQQLGGLAAAAAQHGHWSSQQQQQQQQQVTGQSGHYGGRR